MSKHLTDSERLHIVEEYLGSPGASMPSRRSTTSPRGLLETIVRHFCDMTIGLFLRRTDVNFKRAMKAFWDFIKIISEMPFANGFSLKEVF